MPAADHEPSRTPVAARSTVAACVVLVAMSTWLVTSGVHLGVCLTAAALGGLRFADHRWSADRWSAGAFLLMVPMFVVMIVSVIRR
jgi:hypothetical protein